MGEERPPSIPPGMAARSRRMHLRAAAGGAGFLIAALACAAYVAASFSPWQLAAAWAAAEALFIFVYRDRLRRFNEQPATHRPADHDGAATARKFMTLRKYFPFSDSYLRPWFRYADMSSIMRENVLELLSYGFWYHSKEDVAASGDLPFLDSMVTQLQKETGIDLKEGSTPGLPFMSHLWDALPALYRPLAFYAFTECIGVATHAMLLAAGFQRHDVCGLVYYTHPGDQAAASGGREAKGQQAPIVIMHGVAAGIFPYLGLVFLMAGTGRPLVVPEYRHVSMRLTATIPTIEQLVASTRAFLQALGHEQVHVVGHSYGSLVASRFVQQAPKAVVTLTLLDPVCFAMFMPTLLDNFLYTFPRSGNMIIDAGMYFVSRELHMTATFCRQFYWSDYNLWPEHLPKHTLVTLAGQDRLCQAHNINRWLTSETAARVLFDPDMCHAHVLARPDFQSKIFDQWNDMADKGDREAAAARALGAAVAAKEAATAAPAALGEEEEAARGSGGGIAAGAATGGAEEPAWREKRRHGRPEPFSSARHARAAAGDPVSGAAAAAAEGVEHLVRQLRQQQERVRAQEEANIAAARQLAAIVEAVRRTQTAPAAAAAVAAPPLLRGAGGSLALAVSGGHGLAGGPGRGGDSSDATGDASDISSMLEGASSLDSDSIEAVLRPTQARRRAAAAAAAAVARRSSDGAGDAAVLGAPFWALAGDQMAAPGAAALRRRALLAGAGGGVSRKGSALSDSMSIDLGALAYCGYGGHGADGVYAAAPAKALAAAAAGAPRALAAGAGAARRGARSRTHGGW